MDGQQQAATRSDGPGERPGQTLGGQTLGSQTLDGQRGAGIRLTTYYNGGCPVCRAEIRQYKRISRAGDLALAWCDVSRDRYIAKRLGLDREAVKRRLHAIDREGRLFVGTAAFAAIWRELPGYRWAAWLISRPLIRPVAGWIYDNVLAAGLYALNRARERRQAQSRA